MSKFTKILLSSLWLMISTSAFATWPSQMNIFNSTSDHRIFIVFVDNIRYVGAIFPTKISNAIDTTETSPMAPFCRWFYTGCDFYIYGANSNFQPKNLIAKFSLDGEGHYEFGSLQVLNPNYNINILTYQGGKFQGSIESITITGHK